jgi:hypothetical protein
MYINKEHEVVLSHYLDLPEDRKIEVASLLWKVYIDISLDEDLPPEVLLRLDMNELEQNEAYEVCQLYKDTLEFVEYLYNQ